jgi:hypothetical protein
MVLEYEDTSITAKERSSTKPEDIQRCLKAGVLPKCYENTIMEIEVQEQNQLSCFIRHENDTVTCPMGCVLTRVRTLEGRQHPLPEPAWLPNLHQPLHFGQRLQGGPVWAGYQVPPGFDVRITTSALTIIPNV